MMTKAMNDDDGDDVGGLCCVTIPWYEFFKSLGRFKVHCSLSLSSYMYHSNKVKYEETKYYFNHLIKYS
jgi:hypothetical protein